VEGEAWNVGRVFGTLCASLIGKNYQRAFAVAHTLGCDRQTLVSLFQLQDNKLLCLITGGEQLCMFNKWKRWTKPGAISVCFNTLWTKLFPDALFLVLVQY
jgi:hypothetical protein